LKRSGLACLQSLLEVGAGLLVLRRARAVAVSGRVDGGDGVTAGGHAVACTGQQSRCFLVQAATVTHQHQGR